MFEAATLSSDQESVEQAMAQKDYAFLAAAAATPTDTFVELLLNGRREYELEAVIPVLEGLAKNLDEPAWNAFRAFLLAEVAPTIRLITDNAETAHQQGSGAQPRNPNLAFYLDYRLPAPANNSNTLVRIVGDVQYRGDIPVFGYSYNAYLQAACFLNRDIQGRNKDLDDFDNPDFFEPFNRAELITYKNQRVTCFGVEAEFPSCINGTQPAGYKGWMNGNIFTIGEQEGGKLPPVYRSGPL